MLAAREAIDTAHEVGIPVIFIQEIHRPDGIDFGRELNGNEGVHCLQGDPGTDVAKEEIGFRDDDILPSVQIAMTSGQSVTGAMALVRMWLTDFSMSGTSSGFSDR